jgi:hypothetical protein
MWANATERGDVPDELLIVRVGFGRIGCDFHEWHGSDHHQHTSERFYRGECACQHQLDRWHGSAPMGASVSVWDCVAVEKRINNELQESGVMTTTEFSLVSSDGDTYEIEITRDGELVETATIGECTSFEDAVEKLKTRFEG